jgi:hypothetical protein
MPGTGQKIYNVVTGDAESIDAVSYYTLKFFTWENSGASSRPPRISVF